MEFYHQFPTSTILVEVHRFMVEIDYYKNVSKQVSTNETTKNREKKKKKKKTEKFHCGSRAIQKIMPKAAKMETIIKYLWSE